jgi:hypothetical protein
MNIKEYRVRCINLYLVSIVILVMFIGFTYIRNWFDITNYIGQFGARSILFILFFAIIAFYGFTFIKTRKYYYFSVPYLLVMIYFLLEYLFWGFILFSETFP